ncbi:hypothetical protein BDW74DRAFT_155829, partial [Aspergillus multicolor]|uniref:uncharacterized protein n=1 Tax=Aspergillus multicolor TaxID=41759 RepID=UPI003CCD61CC
MAGQKTRSTAPSNDAGSAPKQNHDDLVKSQQNSITDASATTPQPQPNAEQTGTTKRKRKRTVKATETSTSQETADGPVTAGNDGTAKIETADSTNAPKQPGKKPRKTAG